MLRKSIPPKHLKVRWCSTVQLDRRRTSERWYSEDNGRRRSIQERLSEGKENVYIALGAGDMLLESIVNESGDVYQNIKTGLFISGTGLLITAVGLPLMLVGKKKSIEFTLGPTTQGLGIALNF